MSTRHVPDAVAQRAICTGETPNTIRRTRDSASLHVIPEANDPVQQYLEASILLAWAEMTWLRFAAGLRSPSFVAAIHPASDRLGISVSSVEHLAPLLGRILPINTGGVVVGIPGLRVRLGRNHLDLVLLTPSNNVRACVRFLGVSRQRLGTLLRDLTRGFPDEQPLIFEERAERVEARLFAGPRMEHARVFSAILRRISLWGTTLEVQPGVRGGASVRWQGAPSDEAVATILGWSACEIPSAVVHPQLPHDGVQHITIENLPSRSLPSPAAPMEIWPAVEAVRASRTGGIGDSPVLAEDMVTVMLWGAPDLAEAISRQQITHVYRLLRRAGLSDTETAALTGQSLDEVGAVLSGGPVSSRAVVERVHRNLLLPKWWM